MLLRLQLMKIEFFSIIYKLLLLLSQNITGKVLFYFPIFNLFWATDSTQICCYTICTNSYTLYLWYTTIMAGVLFFSSLHHNFQSQPEFTPRTYIYVNVYGGCSNSLLTNTTSIIILIIMVALCIGRIFIPLH